MGDYYVYFLCKKYRHLKVYSFSFKNFNINVVFIEYMDNLIIYENLTPVVMNMLHRTRV